MKKIINLKKEKQNQISTRGVGLRWGRYVCHFLAMVFLATTGYVLFYADFLDIVRVDVSGLERLEEKEVRREIDAWLQGNYPLGISRRNLVLFDRKVFAESLKEKFKRVESVSIEKIFPGNLRIEIEERKILMLLCSGERCYTLNQAAMAYAAENFDPVELEKENLVSLRDLSGVEIGTEMPALEEDFMRFVLAVDEGVKEKTGIVLSKEQETPSRVSGDLRVLTEEGWKIFFNTAVGLEKELLMLKTVLEKELDQEKRQKLEYVDLRIEGKVFYKLREENIPAEEKEKSEENGLPKKTEQD